MSAPIPMVAVRAFERRGKVIEAGQAFVVDGAAEAEQLLEDGFAGLATNSPAPRRCSRGVWATFYTRSAHGE
jgi:hypothetical protein